LGDDLKVFFTVVEGHGGDDAVVSRGRGQAARSVHRFPSWPGAGCATSRRTPPRSQRGLELVPSPGSWTAVYPIGRDLRPGPGRPRPEPGASGCRAGRRPVRPSTTGRRPACRTATAVGPGSRLPTRAQPRPPPPGRPARDHRPGRAACTIGPLQDRYAQARSDETATVLAAETAQTYNALLAEHPTPNTRRAPRRVLAGPGRLGMRLPAVNQATEQLVRARDSEYVIVRIGASRPSKYMKLYVDAASLSTAQSGLHLARSTNADAEPTDHDSSLAMHGRDNQHTRPVSERGAARGRHLAIARSG
jgi:hypothetical protein